jgi:ferrous iron transport protein B
MGAIRREMNSAKWTLFAIAYQCGFAYAVALVIYQLGMLFSGQGNAVGSAAAFAILASAGYMLFKPYKEAKTLNTRVAFN